MTRTPIAVAPNGVEILLVRECWLYVTRPAPGLLAVYRSVLINDAAALEEWLEPVSELFTDAVLLSQETMEDDSMMYGLAEMLIYQVAE
jgi:hypothetical protein